MYERMRNQQIGAYQKYFEKKDDIEFRNKGKEISNRHYRKRKDKQQAEHNGA